MSNEKSKRKKNIEHPAKEIYINLLTGYPLQ